MLILSADVKLLKSANMADLLVGDQGQAAWLAQGSAQDIFCWTG